MVAIARRRVPAPAPPSVAALDAPAPRCPADAVPELLAEVVDLLFPRLTPYEAAFYLHLLRHATAAGGVRHVRVSVRRLMKEVVRSPRARGGRDGRGVSMPQVQAVLAALQGHGAIRKDGEPTRAGTLYRVFVPEEIAACRAAKRARRTPAPPVDVAAEADHYNVRANRLRIFERDGYRCRYCAKQLTRMTATLDHVVPVAAGGGNGWDNLVTACLACNSAKTGRAVGDFLAER